MASIPSLMVSVTAAEIAKLSLQPGDKIVLRHPDKLPVQAVQNLRDCLQANFPGHECIVLSEGMSLEIVRPEPVKFREFL